MDPAISRALCPECPSAAGFTRFAGGAL